MSRIAITHITSKDTRYQAVWELREEVLRKPLGMSLKNEDLSKDHTDVIFIAETGAEDIGCLMLHEHDSEVIQFRQMAVYDKWQGRSIGRQLILAAELLCRQKEYRKIILHARSTAIGFYASLGYMAVGDEFTEVGIAHYIMEKRLY